MPEDQSKLFKDFIFTEKFLLTSSLVIGFKSGESFIAFITCTLPEDQSKMFKDLFSRKNLLRQDHLSLDMHSVEIAEILSQSILARVSWKQCFYYRIKLKKN